MKKRLLMSLALLGCVAGSLVGCTPKEEPVDDFDVDLVLTEKPADDAETRLKVAYAKSLTYDQLVAAAKAEMEASTSTFKVLGLTSVLKTVVTNMANKFDWLKYEADADGNPINDSNVYVNNGYKDYTLLQALYPANLSYVADYALTQDERSIADYTKSKRLINFIPSDWRELGLSENDIAPLKGVHFNKVFWTNTNFEKVNGFKLYNIWQVAGKASDKDHCSKVSFQGHKTEQINLSFLLSCYDEANQERIENAYKNFYGTKWKKTSEYSSAGEQWVKEFLANVSRWHTSDGTAMKETQLKTDWNEGYVYFGAFSKMKDAAGKDYAVPGQDTDTILKDLVKDGKVNAMKTVKWDWEIDGFNGYMYTMDSQIVNNAEHPYTACLFARELLDPTNYTSSIYNSKTPNSDGNKGNQYGYYYPGQMDAFGTAGAKVTTNSFDWTKAKWFQVSLVENYQYLRSVSALRVAELQALDKTTK